jgi:NDP-sugar pyrophosphorylase family protein
VDIVYMFLATNLFKLSNAALAPFFHHDQNGWLLLNQLPSILKALPCEKQSPIKKGVFLQNEKEISIGRGCVIEEGSFIEGPCFIGDGSEIRHGAYIRKGSVIGNECVIGHATEVNRSLILDGAKLAHFNYVGDSIVGEGANLGAGSKCANLRLDEREIAILFNGERILTGRKKLGALIGFGASIGCNAVLNPGTIIFPHTKVAPCLSIKGVVV